MPATPLYDVPRHPKHNQATSEVEVEVVMVSTLYEKFENLLTCKDCHLVIMNVIESNIIESNITKILILAYEYVTETIHISKTQIKARKVH